MGHLNLSMITMFSPAQITTKDYKKIENAIKNLTTVMQSLRFNSNKTPDTPFNLYERNALESLFSKVETLLKTHSIQYKFTREENDTPNRIKGQIEVVLYQAFRALPKDEQQNLEEYLHNKEQAKINCTIL